MDNLYYEGFTQNRELSLLRFNERLLEEACDKTVPLLERLRFLSIFSSNLDEFFMVRVGALIDEYEEGSDRTDELSGMNAGEQLNRINEASEILLQRKDKIYSELMDELRQRGINKLEYEDLTDYERAYADQYFDDKIRPLLGERLLDDSELPFIESGTPHIIGTVFTEKGDRIFLARIPEEMSSIISFGSIGDGEEFRFMLLETLIKSRLSDVFTPFPVRERITFTLTRNGEVKLGETGNAVSDMLEAVEKRRSAEADRVVLDTKPDDLIRNYLMRELSLNENQIYVTKRVSFDFLDELDSKIPEHLNIDLLYEKYVPSNLLDRLNEPIIDAIRKDDILLSYPYDSMEPFLKLLESATIDERVREIRITIYRLSSNPRIAEYLMTAAKNGKKVRILIELRARFDEERNIEWAEKFKRAGCKVYFGSEDYKVHSKLFQLVLLEGGDESFVTYLSTGNFNEKTAKIYTDLALITSDPRLGEDADRVFTRLLKGKTTKCDSLAVSPETLFDTLVHYIRREASKRENGRIFIKCNSINESSLMEELMLASSQGCRVVLLVRGVCCILPGIEGCTENIVIHNLVGRFLEHSRVYIFGEDDEEVMYISSADLMKRNMHKRVEIACPILSAEIRQRIRAVMYLNIKDNVKGRIMRPDGTFARKSEGTERIDSQKILMEYSGANKS